LESFIVSGPGSDLTVLIRILRREYIIFTPPLPQHTGKGLEGHGVKKMVYPSPENLFPSDLKFFLSLLGGNKFNFFVRKITDFRAKYEKGRKIVPDYVKIFNNSPKAEHCFDIIFQNIEYFGFWKRLTCFFFFARCILFIDYFE